MTPRTNRWLIVFMGTLLQLCLGTVYAWSYFQKPLAGHYGWNQTSVAAAFSLAICFLGVAAAVGGLLLPRFGPRRLAMTGGVLFGAGYMLAALGLHWHSLVMLYVGYGIVGGIGLGLGYVTPVATVARWFPEKKGLATGTVIMGFGFGALLMSKVLAPWLLPRLAGDYAAFFFWLGMVFAAATVFAGSYLQYPPEEKESLSAKTSAAPGAVAEYESASAMSVLVSPRFLAMWCIFFCNILAGILLISRLSPAFQSLLHDRYSSLISDKLAEYGATLIAAGSLFNGIGRMAWGAVSDRIGRVATFRWMLGSQVAVFCFALFARDCWVFAVAACYVLLCYGGGFGSMPAFVADSFGKRLMPLVYGVVLTAWSVGGVVGPLMFNALVDRVGERNAPVWAFSAVAVVLGIGFVASCFLAEKKTQ